MSGSSLCKATPLLLSAMLAMPCAASDSADRLCQGPASARPPVYITFDASHRLYSMQMRTQPDGARMMERHDVGPAEVHALCGEGFDVRAAADAAGRGDFFPVAVEFYHPVLDHYFLATSAVEIGDLDSGAHPGWHRTGEAFRIYVNDPSWPSGAEPLADACRYYGRPEYGLNTHFFSPSADECDAVAANWPLHWVRETASAFRVHMPAGSDGSCVPGTVPLYRLYNNRADVNHRYTTSPAVRQAMIERSWVSEGHGPLGVAMCVRPA